MLKHRLLTLLVVVAMMAVMAAGVSADDNQTYQQSARSAQQSAPAICFVAGHYFLTPAEGLRRIGTWTNANSASDECPSA